MALGGIGKALGGIGKKKPSVWAQFFGWIGNVASLFLFASPVEDMITIRNNQSVGGHSPIPYLAGFLNCGVWLLYSLGLGHESDPMKFINSVGVLVEFGYVMWMLYYADEDVSRNIYTGLVVDVLFAGLVATLAHGLSQWLKTLGVVGILSALAMYASPLGDWWTAYSQRNLEGRTPNLSVAMLANAICWFVYAAIAEDYYVMIPNFLGLLSTGWQLWVYVTVR